MTVCENKYRHTSDIKHDGALTDMTHGDRKAMGAVLFILGLILHHAPLEITGWQLALPVHLIAVGFFFAGGQTRAKARAAA